MHHAAKGGKHTRGTGIGSDVRRHLSRPVILQIREENLPRGLVAHRAVTGIAHHSNNFDIRLCAGIAAHSDMPSDGTPTPEIAARKLLVDYSHFAGSQRVAIREIAPREHWYT